MLKSTETPTETTPSAPSLTLTRAPEADACPLKLALSDSADAIRNVSRALNQTQRRLDNLRNLIDRFELDDDDDGPRAA